MEKHLDIHQEGVKATWTTVQGSCQIILVRNPLTLHYRYRIGDTTRKNMASTGIEPATFALLARRSNQLS